MKLDENYSSVGHDPAISTPKWAEENAFWG